MSLSNFGILLVKRGKLFGYTGQRLLWNQRFILLLRYRYRAIAARFYKGVDGIILVYDITNRESFDKINSWVKQATENTTKELPFVLVGNKCDLEEERDVSTEEGEEFAKKQGYPFIEVSALSKENIDTMFEMMVRKILPKKLKAKREREEGSMKLKDDKKNNNKNKGCG